MENILTTQSQHIKTTFLLRRGLISEWEEKNPILAYGEPGVGYEVEDDTVLSYVLKIGDGKKPWKDLEPVASKEGQLKYENVEYEINNLVNQYIVLGPPQESGERLPAAGMIYKPYGSADDPTDINEYGTSDNMIVDGKSSFAVGRGIQMLRDDESGSKPNYCSAFGSHHIVYGYGSTVCGANNIVYPNSKYSLTSGRQVVNYGNMTTIGGVGNKRFDKIVESRADINSIADITSAEQMLTIFKEAGNGKQTSLAYGNYSTNFGIDNITYGANSATLGGQNFAGGNYSIALGQQNEAMGKNAIALGFNNKVDGEGATAFGYKNIITKQDHDPVGSFAAGMQNLVTGGYAFAAGVKSQASTYNSFALGRGIKTNRADAMFVGQFNDHTDTSVIFGVGNGSGNSGNITLSSDEKTLIDGADIQRQNAFTVHSDGHAEVQTQGVTDNSVARVDYVNNLTQQYLESCQAADKTLSNTIGDLRITMNEKINTTKNNIEKTITEDVYLKVPFETTENDISLTNLPSISTEIQVTTLDDFEQTNIIIDNGVITGDTLSTVAYQDFLNKFEVIQRSPDDSEMCLYAASLSNQMAYYKGWTTGSTTEDLIHIETDKSYFLVFDLIGNIATFGVSSRLETGQGWHYFSNETENWETQVLYFRTASTIDNANYIIGFGCPSDKEYQDTYIKNIRVIDATWLTMYEGTTRRATSRYNPITKSFKLSSGGYDSVTLRLTDYNYAEYIGPIVGLKGTHYSLTNSAIESTQAKLDEKVDTTTYTNYTEQNDERLTKLEEAQGTTNGAGNVSIKYNGDWTEILVNDTIVMASCYVDFGSLEDFSYDETIKTHIYNITLPMELETLEKFTITYNQGTDVCGGVECYCDGSTLKVRLYSPIREPDEPPAQWYGTIVAYH